RAAHSGGIDDGHPLGVGDVDELSNVGHSVPRLGTAGIAPALDRFEDRFGAVPAEIVVDVDHEQGWAVAEAGTCAVSRRGEHLLVMLRQEPIANGLGHGAPSSDHRGPQLTPCDSDYDVLSQPVWEMSKTTASGPAHFISKLRWRPGATGVSIPFFWTNCLAWASSNRREASSRSSTPTPKWWMPL